MSAKIADAFSSAAKKTDLSGLISSTRKIDTSSILKKAQLPSFKKVDVDASSAAKKLDASSAAKKLEGLKKLETSSLTKRFGDTVKKSNFYKKNQGKLLALGLTVATLSAWYGTLLAQGLSPAEAWDQMTEDIGNAGAAVGEQAVEKLLKGAWQAFVVLVHNLAGKHMFEDTAGTEMGLKIFLSVIVVVRLFSLMGINIFGVIFGLIFGKKSK